MRKLESHEEIMKRQRRNQIIVGVVMIALLVLSTAGFSLMSGEEEESSKVQEKGLTFYRNGNVWAVNFGEQIFYFENLPSEVEEISVNGSVDLEDYVNKPVYLVNPTVTSGSILNNLQGYVLRAQETCLNGTNCTNIEFPVKDCDENLLIFEESEEEEINVIDNCVFIKGYGSRVGDAFIYEILNIN